MQYKLAVCQLSVTSDKATNIAHARERIEAAADNGAQLIVLPVSQFFILGQGKLGAVCMV